MAKLQNSNIQAHLSAESHFPLKSGEMGEVSIIFKHGRYMVKIEAATH